MIQNISIEKLYPHLGNPRKDLGDLSELAESIKAQGVLQNLTVVPHTAGQGYCPSCTLYLPASTRQCKENHTDRAPCPHWQDAGRYTVIIGHRRLAAAKLAGLTEMPCSIVEMTEQEQIATMMAENMQRADLTVYEQAQGFQTMLDLGLSVSDISERTGFSDTTVRRRVKLLDFDKQSFADACQRGGTLMDFAELEKLTDPTLRDRALNAIGTNNFDFVLRNALRDQSKAERLDAWITHLSTFATQVDNSDNYMQMRTITPSNKIEEFVPPEDADEVAYFFFITSYGYIYLLKEKGEVNKQKNSEAAEREAMRRERYTQLKSLSDTAFELRQDFVRKFASGKKRSTAVMEFAVRCAMLRSRYCGEDWAVFAEANNLIDENGDYDMDDIDFGKLAQQFKDAPEKMLVHAAYALVDDGASDNYVGYRGEHEPNEDLDALYAALVALGYEMSDVEKQLQDGTHELFVNEKAD